ncbi:5792_t:CDS:2, partial [Racocetra fulgida]
MSTVNNWLFKPQKVFSANNVYIVAVSGGPDSMFLLDNMRARGYKIVVAHVNYHKRVDSLSTAVRQGKIWILRPLLSFTKEQIIQYLIDHKIDYAVDSTNQQPIYQRNILRPFIANLKEDARLSLLEEITEKNRELKKTKSLVKKQKKFFILSPTGGLLHNQKKKLLTEVYKQLFLSPKKSLVINLGADFVLSRIGNYDSTIYRKLSSIVNEKDIGAKLVVTNRGMIKDEEQAQATYSAYDFDYIPDAIVVENLEQINTLIKECNCQKEKETKDKQVSNRMTKGDIAKFNWELINKELVIIDAFSLSAEINASLSAFTGTLDKKKFKSEEERQKKKKEKQIELLVGVCNDYLNKVIKGDEASEKKKAEEELEGLKKLKKDEKLARAISLLVVARTELSFDIAREEFESNYGEHENEELKGLIELVKECCQKKTKTFKDGGANYEALETTEEKIELLETLIFNQKIFQDFGKQECGDKEKDLIKIAFNKAYCERANEIDNSIEKLEEALKGLKP